jgi:hypothetical protein
MAKNHIGFQPDQVLRRGPRPFDITCGPTIVDPNVASVRPTQLLKPPQERCDARLRIRIALGESHQQIDGAAAHQFCPGAVLRTA